MENQRELLKISIETEAKKLGFFKEDIFCAFELLSFALEKAADLTQKNEPAAINHIKKYREVASDLTDFETFLDLNS